MSFSTEHFLKLFREKEDKDLFEVLHKSDEYEANATYAARTVLEERGLTTEDILDGINEVAEIRIKPKRKIGGIFDRIDDRQMGSDILDAEEVTSISRGIKVTIGIIIAGGILSELGLITNFITNLEYYRQIGFSQWNFTLRLSLLLVVILPFAIGQFWQRKRIGWATLATFFMYVTISSVAGILVNLDSFISVFQSEFLTDDFMGPVVLGIFLAFFIQNIWIFFIFNKSLRRLYEVTPKLTWIAFGIAAPLATLAVLLDQM